MKKILLIACASLITLATAQAETGKPSVVTAEKTQIKATVQDIDYDKREVTVKGPEGKTNKLKVGDEVRNFDQIKKGDEIVTTFFEAVAVSLVKKGDASVAATKEESVYVAEKGQKPGALSVETVQVAATVEDVNREKREVTLKGPEGNSVKVKVDESVGDLKKIKKGDEVVATYTEALAISVRTPGK